MKKFQIEGTTQKAYSLFEVKSIDSKSRTFEGWATTPSTDRVGDTIDPLGAQFKNPLALLHQHNHSKPIGKAVFGKPTAKGIQFTAEIASTNVDGELKNRLDTAWGEVALGLIRAVSIGFRPIKYAFRDDGGVDYQEIEIYELSIVTVPALPEAVITQVKSMDGTPISSELVQTVKSLCNEKRASSGNVVVKLLPSSGVTDKKPKPIILNKGNEMKTIAEQIADFKAAREKKAADLDAIMTKSGETGETLDAEQEEAYDTLEAEIAAIDKHLTRLASAEKIQASKAVSVQQVAIEQANLKVATPHITVKHNRANDGIALAQMVKCIGRAQGSYLGALQIAESAGESLDARVKNVLKAAVAAGSTANAAWAGNLVGDETSVYADFIEFLRPQTILGKFGSGNIPALRTVPFRTPLIGQTSGGNGYWVGEGAAKPLTSFDFSRTTLEPLKVANIAVLTEEVLRSSAPSADGIIRDQLVAALRERLDIDFIDPDKAAAAGISPASILNGVTGIPASGTGTADNIRTDIKAIFAAFIAANNTPTSGVWIMPATVALGVSLLLNPLGQPEFPGLSMSGGVLFGLPVIISEYVPTDSDGSIVALVNASDIYLGDEGGFRVDLSREASLQMDNAPTMNSTTPTGTSVVSLWQTNSVGFRAEREINWARRRNTSVQFLTGVNWGG
jgi:HK97 family phage major capsid protein/HK97 family phage prohead protease